MPLLPALLLACTPLLNTPHTYVSVDSTSTALREAIDLNGDGVDELIASDYGNYVVGVQTDGGTYHFERLSAPGTLHAVGDANEHGWRTLLTGNAQELSVFSRGSDGVWTRVRAIRGEVIALASEDLDGDGRREIILVNDRRLRVLDMNGNERFAADIEWRAFFRIFAADVTGDGKRDLIVARRGTESPVPHPPILSDGFVSLYRGRGDATFEPETRILQDVLVDPIAVADFNGDAHLDILLGAEYLPLLLRGDGRGGFQERPAPVTGGRALDLDGDGIMDVLGWNYGIYMGTGAGLVRRGTYVFDSETTGLVLARRAPGARPVLLGSMSGAREIYVINVECATARGRVVRH